MKRLTPLKAIRAKCIDCSGFELKSVRECSFDGINDKGCPLHPLRMGRGGGTKLKKIRAYCLWCCNDQNNEVKLCPVVQCSLWEYRFGRRQQKCPDLSKIATPEGVLEANRV